MLAKFKNISPQFFFLYAAIFFFLVFNIVTPPLQAPDEFNHFYRAYQLAEGQFLPNKTDNRLGGEIPNCINEFVFPYDNAATELRLTLTPKDILNSFTIKHSKEIPRFKDFPNTSYYSLVSYLPQTIAIFITKQFNCSMAFMYYAGRLLTFLVWLLCMYFVIKTVPVYKWLFTLMCLLPMNIFITNSFSADTVSNILSFLFIALILKHTFSEEGFRLKHLYPLLIIAALLALAKVVYIGLVLSFLIIPISQFKNKIQYLLFAVILFAVAFMVSSYWSGVVMKNYTPYADYNPQHRDWICLTNYSNYHLQKAYILSHPTYFPKVIYRSIFEHPYFYLQGYIGIFANYDIPLPQWLIIVSYIILLFIALFERNKFSFTILQKIIMFGASFCAFVLLLLSQHLTWDAVGEGIVDIVQGRYLIPIFPFLFFALGNYKLKVTINCGLVILLLLALLYTVSTNEIIHRYYIGKCVQKNEFTCDAESVNPKGLLSTSNPAIFLQGGELKNDSVAHNGKSSLALPPQGFGVTYKFNNLNDGDLLELSLWQKGEGAVLVVSGDGDNCKKMYFSHSTIHYYDEKGWGRLYTKLSLPKNCQNAKLLFYVWNPTRQMVYVDNLEFTIRKFAQ